MRKVVKRETGLKVAVSVLVLAMAAMFVCSGCAVVEFVTPEGAPKNPDMIRTYQQTQLLQSTAADVLALVNLSEYELLTQSNDAIASIGQKKEGYKTWLNMIAFDENSLTATRKYFFSIDEKPKVIFADPRAYMVFRTRMVMDQEMLEEAYPDENIRRREVLKTIKMQARRDFESLQSESKMIQVCGMMINEAINRVLVDLEASPALAKRLSSGKGLKFQHPSLEKGYVLLNIDDETQIVEVKIDCGSLQEKLKLEFERDYEIVEQPTDAAQPMEDEPFEE